MSYCIDCSAFSTSKMLKRFQNTDLIPSLECIREQAESILIKFKAVGIDNLDKIRKSLSTKKKLNETGQVIQIDEDILILFKREIEGWVAKERSIDEFEWIPDDYRRSLIKYGITNSKEAFNSLNSSKSRKEIGKTLNVQEEILQEIYNISSLLRIRWLSPNFIRILNDLNHTVESIQNANAELLTQEIDDHNKKVKYYKGKIGERDINRIIFESQYVES